MRGPSSGAKPWTGLPLARSSDGGWRPSPYQKSVALLTALIVALVVVGVQRIRHVHHETALDTAAREGVALEVQQDDGSTSEEGFRLYSTSTGDVRVA